MNPRKRKDPRALDELMESIREHGVITPISVKRVTPTPEDGREFEVVMGDRRFTASTRLIEILRTDAESLRASSPEICAELETLAEERSMIPCAILVGRELEDCEEKQLVENLQREEMSTLDVARGFAWLVQIRGYSVARLSEKLSCCRGFVLDRLRLLHAPDSILAALSAGEIPLRVALEVARIPAAEDREKCAVEVLDPAHYDEPLTLIQTRQWIAKHYVISLMGSRFDQEDETLVPEAGKCSVCPYRGGNLEGAEVASGRGGRRGVDARNCHNPSCYRAKSQAAWERMRAGAEAAGKAVLAENEAARVFSGAGGAMAFDAPYIDLDTRPGSDWTGHFASGKTPAWREILAESGIPVVIAQHPETSRIHELVRRDLATAALISKRPSEGIEVDKSPKLAKAERSEGQRDAADAKRRRTAAAIARVGRVITGLSDLTEIPRDLMLEVTVAAYATHYDAAQLIKRALRLGEDPEAFRRHLDRVTTNQGLFAILATLVVSDDLRNSSESVLFETLEGFVGLAG